MLHQDSSTLFTIDRNRAAFTDRDLEERFNRHFLPERNAQLKVSSLLAAVFYVVFGVTDIATLGPTATAWLLIGLRAGVALVALAGCFAIFRKPASVSVSVGVSSTLLVVALEVFMVICWFQPTEMAWNVMSQAVIVMAVYVSFPNRFLYAVAIGVGSSIVFGAMLNIQGDIEPDDLLTLSMSLVLTNALGLMAARRVHIAQREQYSLVLQLQQLVDRDPLTGCFNRRVLQKGLLQGELTRAYRYGTALSVILCDIDHFKRINDTHGHAAGDQVLIAFAELLLSMTRGTVDSVVRYGGEEFLVVLPSTELAGAFALAERMRTAFAGAVMPLQPGEIRSVTASFGIAAIPAQATGFATTSEAVIGAADVQLYDAKRRGRNGVCGTNVRSVHFRGGHMDEGRTP